VFVGSTEDNPHVSKEVLDEITAGMSAEEKQARRHGKFMAATGLVYPSFGLHNIIPPINPQSVTNPVYVAMDHGLRHPTVWLYGYVDNEGRIIVFHEYYEAERTVAEHAKALDEWEEWTGLKDRIVYCIGDPSIEQRSAATGLSVRSLYSECGRFIGLANNDMRAGLNRVRAYIEKIGLFVTEDCTNLINELQSYRWDSYANRKTNESKKVQDQPRKINDDACDALRYLIMSRPEDEFEGWAGEVRAPFIQAAKAAPSESPFYAAEDLEDFGDQTSHVILGSEW
jgi:phage terminase large subunit